MCWRFPFEGDVHESLGNVNYRLQMLSSAKDPWLSIVTVHKENLDELDRTMASIPNPSTVGIEHLIVDGSAGEDVELHTLDRGLDRRVVIRRPPQGIYDAMNVGLDAVSGTYVLFINSGDALARDLDIDQLRQVLLEAEPVWAYGRVALVSSQGQCRLQKEFNYHSELRRRFRRGRFPMQPACLFKASILQAIGGFDESYRIASDYELMLRLSQIAQPLEIPTVICEFGLGGVSSVRWRESLHEARIARSTTFDFGRKDKIMDRIAGAEVWIRAAVSRSLGRM